MMSTVTMHESRHLLVDLGARLLHKLSRPGKRGRRARHVAGQCADELAQQQWVPAEPLDWHDKQRVERDAAAGL